MRVPVFASDKNESCGSLPPIHCHHATSSNPAADSPTRRTAPELPHSPLAADEADLSRRSRVKRKWNFFF
jgi:hypothetical protein